YSGLQDMVVVLEDRSKPYAERSDYLNDIIHYLGDMHYPMHNVRLLDLRVNDITVLWWMVSTTLHANWHDHLIKGIGLSFSEMAEEYDRLDKKAIRALQQTSIEDWFYSSYQISEKIYGAIETNPNVTQNTYLYVRQHRDDIKEAIRNAGYRLAGLLNEIL